LLDHHKLLYFSEFLVTKPISSWNHKVLFKGRGGNSTNPTIRHGHTSSLNTMIKVICSIHSIQQ